MPITSIRPAYFNPASWAWESGPAPLFLNLISCPPALGYGEHGQGLYRFLDQVRYPHGHLGRV